MDLTRLYAVIGFLVFLSHRELLVDCGHRVVLESTFSHRGFDHPHPPQFHFLGTTKMRSYRDVLLGERRDGNNTNSPSNPYSPSSTRTPTAAVAAAGLSDRHPLTPVPATEHATVTVPALNTTILDASPLSPLPPTQLAYTDRTSDSNPLSQNISQPSTQAPISPPVQQTESSSATNSVAPFTAESTDSDFEPASPDTAVSLSGTSTTITDTQDEGAQPAPIVVEDEPAANHPPHPQRPKCIRIATLNIISAGRSRLTECIRQLQRMHIDVALLTETKITPTATPMTSYLGYQISYSPARNIHQGGVAILARKGTNFVLESARPFGHNVITAQLVTGNRRWLLLGVYIPPGSNEQDSYQETIQSLEEARDTYPDLPLILLGDFNVDLSLLNADPRAADLAAIVSHMGVSDLSPHFKQKKGHRSLATYWKRRTDGSYNTSHVDYICASDRRWFQTVQIRTPRDFDSDHMIVYADIRPSAQREHRKYFAKRKKFPFTPSPQPHTHAAHLFSAMGRDYEPWNEHEHGRMHWVSDETWALMRARAQGKRNGSITGNTLGDLNRQIKTALHRDRIEFANDCADMAQNRIENFEVHEAYVILQQWYRTAAARPFPPSPQDLTSLTDEYKALYTRTPLPEATLPVHINPYPIDDDPVTETEIKVAVRGLKTRRAAGPSGLQAEYLKQWLRDATPKRGSNGIEIPPVNPVPWQRFVSLVQQVFLDGAVPPDLCYATLVLIPKKPNGSRGIGLVEVTWKVISRIINKRIATHVEWDTSIHGFRRHRGCGTALIQAKLRTQVALATHRPLFQIFLDFKKAYDSVDRPRLLQILEKYGVGPRLRGILSSFWDNLQLVPRQGGYHGKAFSTTRGLTQGDIISPLLFNIIIDAVIREWRHQVTTTLGNPPSSELDLIFYADDGRLDGYDAEQTQQAFDLLCHLCSLFGLRLNATKTKVIIGSPATPHYTLSSPAFRRLHTGTGLTFEERQHIRVQCSICDKELLHKNLPRHLQRQHKIFERPASLARTIIFDNVERDYTITMCSPEKTPCPVAGCGGLYATKHGMRVHFATYHSKAHPRWSCDRGNYVKCHACSIMVRESGLPNHLHTSNCKKLAERKAHRLRDQETRAAPSVRFTGNSQELENVQSFCYLGRTVTAADMDEAALNSQMLKASQRWAQLSLVLRKTRANPRLMAKFYKVLITTVLLYGSESWTVTDRMLRRLNSFHHRIACRIAGTPITQQPDGTWNYPDMTAVLNRLSMSPISEYLKKRREHYDSFAESQELYVYGKTIPRTSATGSCRLWWDLPIWSSTQENEEEA